MRLIKDGYIKNDITIQLDLKNKYKSKKIKNNKKFFRINVLKIAKYNY